VKKALTLLLLFLLSACASNTDMYRLRSEIDDLRKQTSAARAEVDNLKEQASRAVKEDAFSAVRESQADTTSQIRDLSGSVQELRGRFDENRFFVEKSLTEAAADRDILRAEISSIEGQLKAIKDKLALPQTDMAPKEGTGAQQSPSVQEETPETTAEPAAAETQEKKEPRDEKTAAYDAAYQAFKEKKYKEAREKFDAFIKDYPKTDLTDNAQFWLAETYFAEKDYEDAILSYEALLKKYPDSKKTGNALLKQAFAFIEINDSKTGKIILNKLIEKFPDSREAELARKKLAELDKKNTRKK
jgi:tol-pal system protein YbgF